LQEVIWT